MGKRPSKSAAAAAAVGGADVGALDIDVSAEGGGGGNGAVDDEEEGAASASFFARSFLRIARKITLPSTRGGGSERGLWDQRGGRPSRLDYRKNTVGTYCTGV